MCSRSLPGVGSATGPKTSVGAGAAEPRLRADLDRAVLLPAEHPVVQDGRPEGGERLGVAAVDDELGEAAGHGRTVGSEPAATNLGTCASSVSPHLRACPSAFSTGTARWPRSRATPSAGSPSPAPATRRPTSGCSRRSCRARWSCVGKNYAAHIAEMNTGDAPKEPLLFLKPSTSVIGPGDAIRIPPGSTNVHHEAELAVVIGARGARNVTPGAGRGQHLRLHDRQRRHRAGHAEERRAVDPRQGLRLLLPDRARGSRPTSARWAWTRPTSRSPAPSTASCASRAAPAS